MNKIPMVPLYIITLLVALPQLSETIYAPSLPALANFFSIDNSMAENTLTIYLTGFAFGVLLWGTLSDYFGRKPIIFTGLCIYLLACLGCYLTTSIETFMFMRFLQAFGASVGSVIGQAVARDSIPESIRGKAFSTISIALAFAPAVGPVFGSITNTFFPWNTVFLLLILFCLILFTIVHLRLAETNQTRKNIFAQKGDLVGYITKLVKDKEVIGHGILVGGVNGILFGYFAESPFYFIEIMNISKMHYGLIAFSIIVPLLLGASFSRKLNGDGVPSLRIINLGVFIIFLSSFTFLTFSHVIANTMESVSLTVVSLLFISSVIFGIALIIPNSLGMALRNHKEIAGTAASLFGFYYYIIASICNSGMSLLHDDTLQAMPTYFLLIGAVLSLSFYGLLRQPSHETILKKV